MRRRDIKIGMRVEHHPGGKDMGVVTCASGVVIRGKYNDGTKWIANPSELSPHSASPPENVEEPK